MISENEIKTEDDKLIDGIVLYKCEDEDVEDVNGNFYVTTKNEDRGLLVKFDERDLKAKLLKIGIQLEQDFFATRTLVDVKIDIYQYKDYFYIEYSPTSIIDNLSNLAVSLVKQLSEEANVQLPTLEDFGISKEKYLDWASKLDV